MSRRFNVVAHRSTRYADILTDGTSQVVVPARQFTDVSPLPRVDGVAYTDLSRDVLSIIAVDRLCTPLRIQLGDGPKILIPLSWIARARTDLQMCPGCILKSPEIRRLCGHDFQREVTRQMDVDKLAAELQKTTTDDRSDPRLHMVKPNGQNKAYLVLNDVERAKGFVRPYRDAYVHDTCEAVTRMSQKISETYAREPKFYGATFCSHCKEHFPVDQFTWNHSKEKVGS